jgi:hypothetical protein
MKVTLRGGTNRRRRVKEGSKEGLYFLEKNEYTIFKPVEITKRRGLR